MVLACLALSGRAQTAQFTQNTGGSNAMTLQVPLANYPGRGVSLPITLHYSTRGLWRIGFINSVYNSTYQVRQSDRNGNTLKYGVANRQWTDTMGRIISMPWPANPGAGDYTYSLPGIDPSTITYTLKFRGLSDVLLPDTQGQTLKPISDYYLPYPGVTPISFGRDGVDGFDVETTSTNHKFTKSGIVRVDSGIPVSGVGVWDHIVWTVDSDLKPRLYVNGSLVFTSTNTQATNATTHGAYLGATEDSTGAIFRYALVQLDEVRLSNTVRSADWIATEYNNQSSPATFYVISSSPLASVPRVVDMTTAGIYNARNAPVRTSSGPGEGPGILNRILFDVVSVVHVSGY